MHNSESIKLVQFYSKEVLIVIVEDLLEVYYDLKIVTTKKEKNRFDSLF